MDWFNFRGRKTGNDIAIIAMTGRFPKSDSVESYWNNLCEGNELITFFTDEELLKAGVPQEVINHPNYVKASPIINDYDKFDAAFFKFAPREAELMDPQQRLMLQCAWELLER